MAWYQHRETLAAEVARHGSVAAAARAHDVPRSTVARFARRYGVNTRHAPPAPTTPVEHNQQPGVTYIIEAVGERLYKIGLTTKDPMRRVQQLQTASPIPLELVMTLDHQGWERVLHHHYRAQRRHGEWFALTQSDLEQLNAWANS